ncbi:MAG TPA: alpha/beta fold hydrolase [Dehalococcoidia bacterium]|nr:alpha/beta fold hydrolase [Dehalococcoidia bacterium]
MIVLDWCVNLESDLSRPEGTAFWEILSRGRRLVSYDRRGVGASQRDVEDFSLEAQLGDLIALVDHLELGTFDLWGAIDGAAIAVAYAARYPQRVSRLVLWQPYPFGEGLIGEKGLSAEESIASFAQFIQKRWSLAAETIADIAFPSGPVEAQRWATRSLRESMSAQVAKNQLEFECGVDVRRYLPLVQTPTLVLHRKGAQDVPFSQGRLAAALIPDARFVALEGEICHPYFDHQQYLHLVQEFLAPECPDGLTPRELEVLRLIAAGRSSREIAAELVLSVRTVERHIANVYTKTDTHGRAQIASYAVERGLTQPGVSAYIIPANGTDHRS